MPIPLWKGHQVPINHEELNVRNEDKVSETKIKISCCDGNLKINFFKRFIHVFTSFVHLDLAPRLSAMNVNILFLLSSTEVLLAKRKDRFSRTNTTSLIIYVTLIFFDFSEKTPRT